MSSKGSPEMKLSLGSLPEVQPIKTIGRVIEWGSKAGLVGAGILLGKSDNLKEVAVAIGVLGGSLLVSYLASFLRSPDKLVDLLDDD